MFTRISSRFERFDHAAMLAIARRRHPVLTKFLQVLTITGEGRSWGAVILLLALGIRFDFLRFPHREYTLFATLTPGIAWIFVKGLKVFWRRRRPYQRLDGYSALTYSPLDDSFPSGHSASVFAFLVAMMPLGPAVAVPLAIWASIVSFSRYYLGVHFPSDIIVGILIGSAAGAGFVGLRGAIAADKYPSYTELAKTLREGVSFRVDTRDRNARTLVLAIHGGIEPGTTEVAEAIAGEDENLYEFRALDSHPGEFGALHVTAANFDDPRALALAKKSRVCVSIHGFKDPGPERVCLGGRNRKLLARIDGALKATFPEIARQTRCPGIEGANRKNIVNRCRDHGVQLELSRKVRDRLRANPSDLAKFAAAVRSAIKPSAPR